MANRILVVANETVAGQALIDAVKRHADRGDVQVHVICPQNQPRHGYVIYDTHIREVMDPDPYAAVMDALGDQDYDEIIISTHPQTRSGWLRQGLPERVASASGR